MHTMFNCPLYHPQGVQISRCIIVPLKFWANNSAHGGAGIGNCLCTTASDAPVFVWRVIVYRFLVFSDTDFTRRSEESVGFLCLCKVPTSNKNDVCVLKICQNIDPRHKTRHKTRVPRHKTRHKTWVQDTRQDTRHIFVSRDQDKTRHCLETLHHWKIPVLPPRSFRNVTTTPPPRLSGEKCQSAGLVSPPLIHP